MLSLNDQTSFGQSLIMPNQRLQHAEIEARIAKKTCSHVGSQARHRAQLSKAMKEWNR